jgi:hypothetical protein
VTLLLFSAVIFLAVLTQSLAGFGSALIAMGALPGLLGIRLASPLVALVTTLLEAALLAYYHQSLNLRAVWRVALASVLGVPLGVILLTRVEERLALLALGLVIVGYAVYALLNLRLPALDGPLWASAVGLLAGVLGGAFNTSGPPVIIYGNCRGWSPAEFKGNLQGFFLVNSLVVLASHALAGNLSAAAWEYFLLSLPAMAVGLWAGLRLDRRLDPAAFRKLVLGLLVVLGGRMVIGVLWG